MDISLNSCNTWFSHKDTKFYKKVTIYQSSVVDSDQLANSLQDRALKKPPESFFGGILSSSSWMLEKMFCDAQREGYKTKMHLEGKVAVKKLTEGRDSLKTALQLLQKI